MSIEKRIDELLSELPRADLLRKAAIEGELELLSCELKSTQFAAKAEYAEEQRELTGDTVTPRFLRLAQQYFATRARRGAKEANAMLADDERKSMGADMGSRLTYFMHRNRIMGDVDSSYQGLPEFLAVRCAVYNATENDSPAMLGANAGKNTVRYFFMDDQSLFNDPAGIHHPFDEMAFRDYSRERLDRVEDFGLRKGITLADSDLNPLKHGHETIQIQGVWYRTVLSSEEKSDTFAGWRTFQLLARQDIADKIQNT